MSRVKVCCWRFFRVSFILLSLMFLLVNLSKSLSLSVEGCSGQKRVVLPPWPPWRRRPWLFKSPRIDTRNWWWVALCRKKSLLLTCTRDSQGFSATLPSTNFWWRRCSRNESSREKQSQTYYCMHVKTIHQIPELRSWSLYVFLMKKKKPDSIWNGAFWLDDSFQKMPRVSILQILALISVYCRDLGDPFSVISYSFQIYVTHLI